MPRGARRCMKCGAKVFFEQDVDPAEAARNERLRVVRKHGLSEMQKGILSAASGDAQEITVCGHDEKAEGEVNSGGQRFYGNEAVAAVAALAGSGLISRHGDDCFRLTAEGRKLARTLEAEPRAEPVGDA